MLSEVLDENPYALLPVSTITIGTGVLSGTVSISRLAVNAS